MDIVRKQELKNARVQENEELVGLMNCRQRFILLKNKQNLSSQQKIYLERLCQLNEPIYQALLLKESFLLVYESKNFEEAQAYLLGWIKESASSSLEIFRGLAEKFKEKMQYILNWFQRKISSAISEGFNNKIKRLKRMAYGYKDVNYFRLKIHQHCGLLNPRLNTSNAT
ncbi:MAG: hypothetical protein DDT40_00689 [candidate division WS2 bacterium]|nr:hypothetical protein [Candidatus Psychracetigena formicireducens]